MLLNVLIKSFAGWNCFPKCVFPYKQIFFPHLYLSYNQSLTQEKQLFFFTQQRYNNKSNTSQILTIQSWPINLDSDREMGPIFSKISNAQLKESKNAVHHSSVKPTKLSW